MGPVPKERHFNSTRGRPGSAPAVRGRTKNTATAAETQAAKKKRKRVIMVDYPSTISTIQVHWVRGKR